MYLFNTFLLTRSIIILKDRIFLIYFIAIACLLLVCIIAYFALSQPSAKKIDSPQMSSHKHNEINKNMLSCSCQEWLSERIHFKRSDPRRLCQHLCTYLANNKRNIPQQIQAFTEIIINMSTQNTGIPHKPPAFAFVLGASGYIATVEEGKYPLITVLAEDKIYSYTLTNGSWENDVSPEFSVEIGCLLQDEIRKRRLHEKNKTIK